MRATRSRVLFRLAAVLVVVMLSLGEDVALGSRISGVTPGPSRPDRVVVIVLDAFRPDYLKLAQTPVLNRMIEGGTSFSDAWVGQLVNNTPPGHASIATGLVPRHTGIFSFSWRDPRDPSRMVRPTSWEEATSGALAGILQSRGAGGLARAVKDAYPGSTAAAVSGHKFYAAASLGGYSANFIMFRDTGPKSRQTKAQVAEGARAGVPKIKPAAVAGHAPSSTLMGLPELNLQDECPDNEYAMRLACALVREYRPRVLLVNLPETDGLGHQTGGIVAPHKMAGLVARTDALIGRLVDLYTQLGLFERTFWVITADHGMVPAAHSVQLPSGKTKALPAGLNHFVYLGKRAANSKKQKAVPDARTAADLIAQAAGNQLTGVYFAQATQAGVVYSLAPSMAGKVDPDLDRAYLYLLSTFAGPESPDVVCTTYEDTVIGGKPDPSHGQHGTVSWGTQHVPLVLFGPGVRRGAKSDLPARLVDIVPTVLQAMGLPRPPSDGMVLAEALANPPREALNARLAAGAMLKPLVAALKRVSSLEAPARR